MSDQPNTTPIKDILDEAALKAVEATNLCTLHMKYHGQQTEHCTPQERTIITIKSNQSKGNDNDARL